MGKIIPLDKADFEIQFQMIMSDEFKKPQRLVLCHGAFDVLHAGHLNYFEAAKSLGEKLIVSITSDRYINKGPGRPFFDENTRARMVASLGVVDYVIITDHPTALEVIEKIRPAYYVKGPDYKDHSKDPTGEIGNEVKLVESYGGKVIYTDTPIFSSSRLVNQFSGNFTLPQKQAIERINELGGYDKIRSILDDLGKLKVLVSGESIIDTYRFVEPQNISSKSPSISAKFIAEENYPGGTLAICNHLESFIDKTIHCTAGNQDTCRKTRYIDEARQQRMFEVTTIANDLISDRRGMAELMYSASKRTDLTMLADFGHGYFENETLNICRDLEGHVALNVQTNSSNYGFNPFTKHERFDYLSIDLREARVAFHDNKSTERQLIDRVKAATGANRRFSITLGSNGATYGSSHCPAFADTVVDATGAGDAYFAITSLLNYVNAPEPMVPFIGNVFAGLKTKIIGNKSSVTKAQLLKALQSILK